MIKFITENKEWLFSGIGVTILIALLAIAKKFLLKKQNTEIKRVIDVSPTNSPAKEGEHPIIPVERKSTLSFSKISEMIENAPPLQRDDVRKNFVGIKVSWDTYLKNASKSENDIVKLYLAPGSIGSDLLYTISCTVSLSDYQELRILPTNAKIRIEGEIKDADIYVVQLINVRLFFFD
jgi:hypothetical protein